MNKKFKLIDLETKQEFEIEELDLTEDTRFVFEVNVGNLEPSKVPEFMELCKERVGDFFGKDKVLYIPFRD